MPTTEATGRQILDGSIGRADLNTATTGSAVIRKLIAGTNIGISYTGVDSGTGDVTVNLLATIGVNLGGTGAVTLTGLLKGNGTSPFTAAVAGTDYQAPISITTTGTSGPATFISNVLNIPQYAGGGAVAAMNRTVQTFTATASQTTFTISGGYTVGMIDVFLNGTRLTGVDYTATNTTTVVLGTGATVGDILDVLIYSGVSITLTTTGTSGASTYNPSTGALNIPNYATGGGGTTTNALTFATSGGVAPTGTFNGSAAITIDYHSIGAQQALTLTTTGTSGAATLVAGTLNIPQYAGGGMVYPGAGIAVSTGSAWATSITDNSTNWNTAYTNRITSITTTGTSGASTISSNVLNIPLYSPAPTLTTGISAAGANQAAATAITAKVNDISTVTSGTGIRLISATVNDFVSVLNHGANPLLVYPATGETIEGGAANAPLTLLEGQAYRAYVSSAGAWFGHDINVWDDENSTFNIPVHASQPATPSTSLRIYNENIGGRQMLSMKGPSGIDYAAQPHIGRQKGAYWQPLGNATTVPITTGIAAATALGTATTRTVATTNIATRMRRLGYASAATAGSLAGIYWNAVGQNYTVGDGTGVGGFHAIFRFVVSDPAAVAGARCMVGMRTATVAPTNVEPSTGVNQIGLAQISTDNTQWYIVYGGSAAQTAIAIGTTIGAPTLNNTVWELALFAPPNSNNTVKYTVINLSSGVQVSGTLTGTAGTALPASTTLLGPFVWRCNNATALAVGIDIGSIYLENDI